MGVTGLWHIVQPCARPIKLETLNRKRLAVDASIWIYQFLKAVRDKEGNALRNSHIVGFFRRICKLLFFGIKPVFVFDGGAPALKRQTIIGRKRRREGRREDAVRTAGKLLAVQLQRLAGEEAERKREVAAGGSADDRVDEEEPLPSMENIVYASERGMSKEERQQSRRFVKKDAYHLPELSGSIEDMGRPDDPRIMSTEELEEYARQFNNGEDINLYDFSKIDFDSDFFMSLPAVDRYNILNAARLRSRLRMGLSKEQLDDMFPDRMEFSRFQIERVRERNNLTQRLMHLSGFDTDHTVGANAGGRIVGERNREYMLVKNDGVEGGWALGVVSTDKSVGERSKPIDVDALTRVNDHEVDAVDEEEDDDFEDVPIEGLNRLPKIRGDRKDNPMAANMLEQRQRVYAERHLVANRNQRAVSEDPNSLFVGDAAEPGAQPTTAGDASEAGNQEAEDLRRAIAMSLETQHGIRPESPEEEVDDHMLDFEQVAAKEHRPISSGSGLAIARIVNNRSNAAVPATRDESSEDEMDFSKALAASRKTKRAKPAPTAPNMKNPFDGPLPFESLSFKTSLFGKKTRDDDDTEEAEKADEDKEFEGGFVTKENDAPKPLPPWLQGGDIRNEVQQQRERDFEINAEDRAQAVDERRRFQRDHGVIELESSDDEVEFVEQKPRPQTIDLTMDNAVSKTDVPLSRSEPQESASAVENPPQLTDDHSHEALQQSQNGSELVEWSESDRDVADSMKQPTASKSPTPDFEDVTIPEVAENTEPPAQSPTPEFEEIEVPEPIISNDAPSLEEDQLEEADLLFEDVTFPATERAEAAPAAPAVPAAPAAADELFTDADFDDFSDPEDEELLAQLAAEAEEHARFASSLNNKTTAENHEDYERELKALRNQQKKDRRDADEVSHIMITECQALLRLFGLPYITAPMEAEAQCSELVRLGLVDGIVTDDSDIFLFGGTRVYKNMFSNNKYVECYLATDLEKELLLSRSQLISIAHLLGSDYTEGLQGIGPVTAMEIVSEFPGNEGLDDFKNWWHDVQQNQRPKDADSSSPFRKKFRRAQATKLFLAPGFPSPAVSEAYMKPDVDHSPEAFQWGVPDLDNLRRFLMSTIGWSQERTDEVLVPVIKDMNRRAAEGTQSNITRFVENGTVGLGAASDSFAPRARLAQGSKRMAAAMNKLRTKKSSAGPLGQTFADQAVEWAGRNELREKAAGSKRKPKRGQRSESVADDAVVDGDDDAEDLPDVQKSQRKRPRT